MSINFCAVSESDIAMANLEESLQRMHEFDDSVAEMNKRFRLLGRRLQESCELNGSTGGEDGVSI